jgi:hypothetical protein
MLDTYFTSTIAISRGSVTGNKTTYAQVSSGVPCHIQPTSGELAPGQFGRFSKNFLIMSRVELRIGDKLIDGAGKEYEVDAVQKLTFRSKTHYEAQARAS